MPYLLKAGLETLKSLHPILYEINTRCWLAALSHREGRVVTLADVPESEFSYWLRLGFTHIWLMGVWTTGPRSRALALNDPGLRELFDRVLPDWREADVSGSPYAIGAYEVPPTLGGESALQIFREKLNRCGLKLLLDFVPNHLGLDHLWAVERPELFVQCPPNTPGSFELQTNSGTRWLAHGKDPYFTPWTDTIQLDYRRPETRDAMKTLLQSAASRCDGVRCDMAMLVLNDVFQKTWVQFPAAAIPPASEFWADAIFAVRAANPGFLFLAEAYWGLQSRLQELGFDFTYDKDLYDRVIARQAAEVQRHLLEASPSYVEHSAHFLENHDERRIAQVLPPDKHRAAAVLTLGLPGMRFLHEGQLSGKRIHVPVQLSRAPDEPVDTQIKTFYENVLTALNSPITLAKIGRAANALPSIGRGEFKLLSPEPAWPGNPSFESFIIVQWEFPSDQQGNAPAISKKAETPRWFHMFTLVVVNLASHQAQCRVRLSVPGLAGVNWELRDLLGGGNFRRDGSGLEHEGLFLDLPGSGAQLLFGRPLGS